MAHHPFDIECRCGRCAKERARRDRQRSRHTPPPRRRRRYKQDVASREVQHGRYLDAGPRNWDDWD